jgi:O-antigen ligase
MQSKKYFVSIFLICSILTLSAFLSQDRWGNGGFEEVIRTLSIFSIFAIARSIIEKTHALNLASAISSVGVFSAFFSIWQFLTNAGMQIEGINRCPGLMAHPNSAALLYGSSIILLLTIEVSSLSFIKVTKITILIFALIFTFSISGILITILGFLLQERFKGKARKTSLFEFLFYCVAFFAVFKYFPQLSERANTYTQTNKFQTQTEGNSLEWRFARWREIINYWEKAPFFGQGYGSTTNGAMLSGYMPHNEYIRVLVELGLIGLIFASFAVLVLYTRLKSKNQTSIVICAKTLVIMSAISALTENTFLYTVHAYILAAIIGIAMPYSNNSRLIRVGKNR